MCTYVNFVRFSISYFCGMNGSIKQYEWFKRLNDRQVNELIGLIDDWVIIDTEPIDSNVWLDRDRWTNIDFVMIFVSGTSRSLQSPRNYRECFAFKKFILPHFLGTATPPWSHERDQNSRAFQMHRKEKMKRRGTKKRKEEKVGNQIAKKGKKKKKSLRIDFAVVTLALWPFMSGTRMAYI